MLIEIKLSTQSAFTSGSYLMGIIHIHLVIYFLECSAAWLEMREGSIYLFLVN